MTDRPTHPIEPNQSHGSAPRPVSESTAHGAAPAPAVQADVPSGPFILDCTGLQAIVSGFVDGELPADDHGLAERHLVGCAACRALVDRVEAIDDDLRALAGLWAADAPLPARVVSGVLDRTTRPGRRERRWRIAGTIGWAAAAAIALSWIATARLGFTPDRAATPERATQVALESSNRESARPPAEGQRRSDRPVQTTPATYDPSKREPSIESASVRTRNSERAGIAQSPADRGPCKNSTRRVGLERTLPALHGEIDWSAVKPRCADARTDARGCEQRAECSAERFGLRPADADTIFATSLLLDRLLRVDAGNLDEIERLRYVIVYDELIERLRDARKRLDVEDRPLASLAQCFLVRLLRGSVEESVITEMKTDLQNVGLHDRLEALSDRLERRPTF